MKVKLQYFKPSGKYYSSGEYETQLVHMFDIFEEVKEMTKCKKLPGLCEYHSDVIVHVTVPENQNNYPGLVL